MIILPFRACSPSRETVSPPLPFRLVSRCGKLLAKWRCLVQRMSECLFILACDAVGGVWITGCLFSLNSLSMSLQLLEHGNN